MRPPYLKGCSLFVHEDRRQADVLLFWTYHQLQPRRRPGPPREGEDIVKTSHGATVKGQDITISVQTDETSSTQHLKHK